MSEGFACPGCGAPGLHRIDGVGARTKLCETCKGIFAHGGEIVRLVGASVPLAPAELSLDAPSAVAPCPSDGKPMVERWAFGDESMVVFACSGCGANFFPEGCLPLIRSRLRSRATTLSSEPRLEAQQRRPGEEDPGRIDRLELDHPAVDLLALPLSFGLSLLLTATSFGRLLVFPIQTFFHELGHAIPSWLSSRAALPLPCGITFTSDEQSVFTGACFVFLLGVLGAAALRERRPFAGIVAAVLFVAWAIFTFLVDARRTQEMILLGGIGGEITLSAFAIAAFYFRVPDRLRWDFFRVVMLPFATLAFVGSGRLWVEIAADDRSLPMGSLFGTHGDGSGDLDRLMAGFGWTPEAFVRLYVGLLSCAALAVTALYLVFAARALRRG